MKKKICTLLAAVTLLAGCSSSQETAENDNTVTLLTSDSANHGEAVTDDNEAETGGNEAVTADTAPEQPTSDITAPPPEETLPPVTTSAGAASDTSAQTPSSSSPGASEQTTASSSRETEQDAPAYEATTSAPSLDPVELTPDRDSDETLLIKLDPSQIGSMQHYTAYTGTVTGTAFQLTNSVYIKKMAEKLNGLLFVERSAEELVSDNNQYLQWQSLYGGEIQPETLVVLDKRGNELIRFYSDAKTAIPEGNTAQPFTRASVNGKEYELFYGEPDYSGMQETLLNQRMVAEGYFFLEVYAQVAKRAAADRLADLADKSPIYRVYTPDAPIIATDGEVLYPDSFPAGTTLVDCLFRYSDGGSLTVTMNAKDAKVYGITENL